MRYLSLTPRNTNGATTMMTSNEFEPPHRSYGPQYIVRGEDESGVWYLGISLRKVEDTRQAVHYTARSTAEKDAKRSGGDVLQVRW